MNFNTDYLTVFALIIAIEAPLVWFRGINSDLRVTWEKLDVLRVVAMVCLVNALVHPMVFFGFLASGKPYLWATLTGQAFAILIKMSLYAWFTRARVWSALSLAFWSTLASWQLTPILIFVAYNYS